MKFYFDKSPIAPHISVLQQGFAARTQKSRGVHDEPYVTVALLSRENTVVIIQMDVLYGDRSFALGIKESLFSEFKIPEQNIIINYSHTHSVVGVTGEDPATRKESPYSMGADKFLWGMDKHEVDYREDVIYYRSIRDKIIAMVKKGLENLTEGEAYIQKGFSTFAVSRRYPNDDGTVSWKPYYNVDAIDPDLFVIKFTDKNNRIRGIMYNYSCHPTTLGADNYLISADYPGVVRRILEEEYEGAQILFLQGCGADAKPYITDRDGSFVSSNYDELEEAGVRLAGEIKEILHGGEFKRINDDDAFLTDNFYINLCTEKWDVSKWQAIADDENVPHYRRKLAEKIIYLTKRGEIKDYLSYYISLIRFDDKTAMIALEGEVVSGLGKLIKGIFPREDLLVLGYSNSSSCYIPTREVLKQGGYEKESFMGARLAGPFLEEVEDMIVGRSALMISKR